MFNSNRTSWCGAMVLIAGVFAVMALANVSPARADDDDDDCPAFTFWMVDAAWMAINFSQDVPPVEDDPIDFPTVDDPDLPKTQCRLRNARDPISQISVISVVRAIKEAKLELSLSDSMSSHYHPLQRPGKPAERDRGPLGT